MKIYAKNHLEESITFFANIIFSNEEPSFEKYIAEYLFCEIAKDKYASVMEEIKDDWAKNNYDNQGKYKANVCLRCLPKNTLKDYWIEKF